MISSNLQSILDNRLRYLPEITGRAIRSVDWASKLIDIGRKYGMHVDELEDLQTVVLKSMIGLIAPEDFENQLISNLAVSPATAEKMIADINAQVFEPIHDFVMNQGKAADPLSASGIHVETEAPEAVQSFSTPHDTAGISFGSSEATPAPQMSVPVPPPAPAVPEPAYDNRPMVNGNYDEFFVNVTTETDHTLGN